MSHRSALLFITLIGLTALGGDALAADQAKTAACAACHGADGNSTNPIWPNLAGQHAQYIVAQLEAFKSGARTNPSMSPMAATVADEDMAAIGAFYAAQTIDIAPLEDADIGDAERLYRGGDADRGIPACMACHGPNGAGNGPARYPALRGQHPEYVVIQLKAYRDGKRTTDPNGMMRDIAGRLTDDEMEQIARYVSALH